MGLISSTERQKTVLEKTIKASDSHIELIRNIPLFQNLNESDLVQVALQMEEKQVEAKVFLLTQGQAADGVYFIQQGKVEVLVNDELVAHRSTGECFGEMSCLRDEIYASASVRTEIASSILKIPREQFMNFVNQSPQLWKKLFDDLTNRFKEASQRFSEVLQHTPQGLVKIDQNGKITDEYSKQCIEYFGTHNLKGQEFHHLLFPENPDEQKKWESVYPMFFETTLISFEGLAELLPQEVAFSHPDGEILEFRLHYYPCVTTEGQMIAVDVGIEDVTEERRSIRKQASLAKEKRILQKLYEDPEAFLSMIRLGVETLPHLFSLMDVFRSNLKTSKGMLELLSKEEEALLPQMMRELHTLKGVSGIFLMDGLKMVSHELEDCLKWMQDNETVTPYHLKQLEERTRHLDKECDQASFLVLDHLSDETRDRMTGVVIDQRTFGHLEEATARGNLEAIQHILAHVQKTSLRKLFRHWPEEVVQLGKRLNKKATLQIEGEEITISKELFQQLEAPLIHILKNSMDHGLESPEERQKHGKSEQGVLRIQMFESEDSIFLEFSDDGRGLNEEKIVRSAKNNLNLDQRLVNELFTTGHFWKLLLLPGFSTAQSVTDVSGRGVGLDAVNMAITELGGQMEISSETGKGCTFSFTLPSNG